MRHWQFSIIASLVVLLAMSACSSAPGAVVPKQATIDISSNEFAQTQQMTRQVDIAEGGTLTVFLVSNPSTGYQWTPDAQITDKAILDQLDHSYIEPQSSGATPSLVGAAGKEKWTFQALKQGTTTVSMRYARPWESNMGLWNLTLTVTVKGG